MALRDHYGRAITYLRLSVTDRCNYRCLYCMPEAGVPSKRHEDILRYEEMARLVRVAAGLGVSKVRLTGGEPLVRAGIADLVRLLAAIPGIDDLALTTNGALLASLAPALAAAGLRRVNVSLDTLRPERFERITRRGRLQDVLDGIEAARRAGLNPVKVNAVVVRGLNDDEAVDFARRSLSDGWHVRFIEVMPLGEGEHWAGDGYVPAGETRARIEAALGPLQAQASESGGPARTWRLPEASGSIGFITPVSEHFCRSCNRLRLTADGRLLSCLLGDAETDVRGLLRGGASDEQIAAAFAAAVAAKPAGHRLQEGALPTGRLMSGIGG
ncbi:MAG: GTP 3',8-cyclase MoaA [Anaerolineae bacterium]